MHRKNKYVDFVSDEHFLKCVKCVCDAYPIKSGSIDMKRLRKNGIDIFKMLFDVVNSNISVDDWVKNEVIRQSDKSINNKVGEFHQKLLGGVKGWVDLGIGDDSKVDLKNNENTIFIELKNKFNTVNSDSLIKVRDKLVLAVKNNPKAIAYWAYITKKDGSSGEAIWNYKGDNNPQIKCMWGARVYGLVTNDATSLEKTWKAIPQAINDLFNKKLSSDDLSKLMSFFKTGIS
ncbi:MAG: Eco47II family restriction endonuclease [Nanoarchaeota archaeon]